VAVNGHCISVLLSYYYYNLLVPVTIYTREAVMVLLFNLKQTNQCDINDKKLKNYSKMEISKSNIIVDVSIKILIEIHLILQVGLRKSVCSLHVPQWTAA
jgi:hypothetical protein